MSDTVSSTNMGMPVPVVGVESGPQWALDINACLSILDSHDHSAGYGVQITPNGLNINSDLSMQLNDLVSARSVRFSAQVSPLAAGTDLGCIYESGVDLYYNDGNGNQVRITQSGAVAGSPGSIGSLTSPASATYVSASSKFVWQSDANTSADMDFGSAIFRNNTASSNGITVSAPAALGSNYSITWPSLPVSQKFMTLDASGNMAAPWAVDGSTIEIATNTVQVKNLGIITAKIANDAVTTAKIVDDAVTTDKILDNAVTNDKLAPLNYTFPVSGTGAFTTASAAFVQLTNCSQNITCTGRPVLIMVQSFNSITGFEMFTNSGAAWYWRIDRDGSSIATGTVITGVHSYTLSFFDPDTSAGVLNYKVYVRVDSANTLAITAARLVLVEL